MVTAAQLRAARGLLDWTRADLAKIANVSPETIKNIEHGTFRPQEATTDTIIRSFAAHDVEFTENEGVRKIARDVRIYHGHEDFKSFMDEIYVCAQTHDSKTGDSKPIYVSNVDNRLFKTHLGNYAEHHINRMIALENVRIKVIAKEQDITHNPKASYLFYRYNQNVASTTPFYVFGDKLAIINFQVENAPHIILISSKVIAESYRKQFEVMWESALEKPL